MGGDHWYTIADNSTVGGMWWGDTTSNTDNINILVPAVASPPAQRAEEPKEEGPLEWLDRRVDEMCVPI